MERKVIIITGATCSGKSKLALLIAEKINSEIISADSRQIYKFLNIGTAKPTIEEQKKIVHHFIDYLEPEENYNVSRFESDSFLIFERLFQENKIPVVAGGSGLYIKAIVDGIFNTADSDEEFRIKLLNEKNEFGNEFLFEKLKEIDPDAASTMLPQNWKRVMRALEVFHLTGKSIIEHHKTQERDSNIKFFQFSLEWDRDVLYKRIDERVEQMIKQGLIEETNYLLNKYGENLNSLNTVGYKEIISFLKNEISKERAIELIKRNTRRFAKRQLTWFRKDSRIKYYKISDESDLINIATSIINETKN